MGEATKLVVIFVIVNVEEVVAFAKRFLNQGGKGKEGTMVRVWAQLVARKLFNPHLLLPNETLHHFVFKRKLWVVFAETTVHKLRLVLSLLELRQQRFDPLLRVIIRTRERTSSGTFPMISGI